MVLVVHVVVVGSLHQQQRLADRCFAPARHVRDAFPATKAAGVVAVATVGGRRVLYWGADASGLASESKAGVLIY